MRVAVLIELFSNRRLHSGMIVRQVHRHRSTGYIKVAVVVVIKEIHAIRSSNRDIHRVVRKHVAVIAFATLVSG